MLPIAGTITIADDRGQPCPLVAPPDPWPKCDLMGRPKDPQADPSIIAELAWARRNGGTVGLFMGLTMFVPMSLARWLLGTTSSLPAWIATFGTPVLAGVLCWPLHPIVGRLIRQNSADTLKAAYLNAARCASCGFDLAAIPPDFDGLRRCPECGFSWRIGRPQEPDPALLNLRPSSSQSPPSPRSSSSD